MATNNIISQLIPENGVWPNHDKLPVVIYQNVLNIKHNGREIAQTMKTNGWGSIWRGGLYGYHHYHSQAHEALGVYSGSADIQFGGEGGITLQVKAGDMVVVPAGVAHKLTASNDFAVVGAYPAGQSPDMKYGRPHERPLADKEIACVKPPTTDPILGTGGSLLKLWNLS